MNRFKKQRQQQELDQQQKQQQRRPSSSSLADGEEDYMSEALLERLQQEQQAQQERRRPIGRKRPKPSSASASAGPAAVQAPPLSRKAKEQAAEEKLQEGLNTPLPEDNVGLRLLKLMGFKMGQGLGKSAGGIAEPLGITKRTGREGIGVAERARERVGRKEELAKLRAEMVERRKAEFAQAMSDRFAERRVAGQLAKAMKTAETLDVRAGRPHSCLWWSNGEGEEEQGEEEEEEDGVEGAARAAGVLSKEADEAGGGGLDEQEGTREKGQGGNEGEGEGEGEGDAELWESLSNGERLSMATAYLRGEYNYCLWCGHQFEGPEELAKECPGEAEDDH